MIYYFRFGAEDPVHPAFIGPTSLVWSFLVMNFSNLRSRIPPPPPPHLPIPVRQHVGATSLQDLLLAIVLRHRRIALANEVLASSVVYRT